MGFLFHRNNNNLISANTLIINSLLISIPQYNYTNHLRNRLKTSQLLNSGMASKSDLGLKFTIQNKLTPLLNNVTYKISRLRHGGNDRPR